jgi:hypothetical protein
VLIRLPRVNSVDTFTKTNEKSPRVVESRDLRSFEKLRVRFVSKYHPLGLGRVRTRVRIRVRVRVRYGVRVRLGLEVQHRA